MGNLPCKIRSKDDSAWKQQNKEMVENPAYTFANLSRGGTLIDAYNNEGPHKVEEIARNEMSKFFYHPDGKEHEISESEFLLWHWKLSQRIAGLDENTENVSLEKVKEEYDQEYFNKFTPHKGCWNLNKRGGVGESPFHLLYLMDSPVHFEVAKILLKIYPNLALDVYEGEEYYGESALHIAIVIGDLESVQHLVRAGANINQRATGRFFLPEDQKKGVTGMTNYDGYAYYGEYPLAFAACFGNTDIYDFLLDHGANPNLQDSFGNTVLHMVVISNQSDMYRYAVRHHKRPANTSIQNKQKLTPLTLACKLGRHSIFKEMLDLDSIEFWRFSTTMCSAHPLRTLDSIGPDGSTNWNSALMIIVNGDKDDHLEMLEGGVIRQLLGEKWKTFAQTRFIVRLILAFIHLTLFSIAIYTRPSGDKLLEYSGTKDAVRYTCEALVCFSCLVTVVYEVMEISTQGIASFIKNCTHAPAQTVHLISCLLILACVPFRVTGLHRVEDILLILAAPCAWFFLLFFARGQQRFGPFVTMIYKMIAGDLFRFGIIYFIFLIGFTQGFFFLFKDVTPTGDDVANFSTLPETILNLFQMTLGEFKYEVFSYSHHSWLTKIIFALFMILVPILLLNMLIAMMGNTYTQVISKSTKEWWKQWAKIVVVLERGVSKKKLLQYQSAYSVELKGAPPSDDGTPAPPAERALVVIKMSKKSRAKTRKGAVSRWK
ncbi:transient receptor potential cation channel subfamily v member 6, partial [Plakobranchus ocellatus]